MTTRRHYPGEHKIVLLVNGYEVACKDKIKFIEIAIVENFKGILVNLDGLY
ncbi:hypothetical protein [Clostridium pasteurianum]|uniref:hypothetical protein n=1 Tax=Clostridium pasteurianum TaxID=1501 RepID=UPI0003A3C0A8|nr:hypothetical protein [Clostridium pasteurianum]